MYRKKEWMGGDSVVAVTPPYLPSHGIRGAQAAANYPGATQHAQSWVGVDGKLWLYGGWGYGSAGNGNVLNDLWRYDPVTGQWTWMWGDTDPTTATGGRIGTYSAGVGNVGRPASRRMGHLGRY